MDFGGLVGRALIFIFPAYCANGAPVISGGGRPIDFGKNFSDGRPIFGKNKTIRGFLFGLAAGTLAGYAESILFNCPILFGFLLSLGALVGDLIAAFAKRRLGLTPGEMLPVVDQVDFIVGGVIFSLPISLPMLSWELILIMLVITPPIHLLTNFAAFKLGLKSNPW